MTNRLLNETSPYLLQHAKNPVHWHPWGAEAIQKAHRENKPILLSIGYAACHWCHVMAHESFEDEETAKLMNEHFINIKVDREERPDLDKIYQSAHHLLTQSSGGWPLTVFLTPDDLTPFYSGTYFPPENRYNLPAFKNVLRTISDIFQHRQHDIIKQNEKLRKILNYETPSQDITLNKKPINLATHKLDSFYDAINGGFGEAPKFPHPTHLEFLLYESSSLAMNTLQKMANGGIYDQLGGGFFRYSVDAEWRIPHFEKMLYDNAQLLYLYAEAYRRYAQPFFGNIARETANWLLETMQSPDGGFYSSMDADSENKEGKYYIWNKSEIENSLIPEESNLINLYHGLNHPANFEKNWHLYIAEPLDNLATTLKLSPQNALSLLNSAKQKLLNTRKKRIAPHIDKKILTAWNALAIKGLMTAGDILQEEKLLIAGQRALDFIHKNLWQNGRLFATYQDGKAKFNGYLDDYAFLLEAILTSLQVTWNKQQLLFAIELADVLLKHFIDDKAGGFYFTADDHEKLVQRPKSMMDEAIPAGNGSAARALLTLGYLLGEFRYIDAAKNTLKAAWPTLEKYPSEHCTLLLALEQLFDPPRIVIIRGNIDEIKTWQHYCNKQSHTLVFAIPSSEQDLPGVLANYEDREQPFAILCQGTHCLAEANNFTELKQVICNQSRE